MSNRLFHKMLSHACIAAVTLALPWMGGLLAASPKLPPLTPEAYRRISKEPSPRQLPKDKQGSKDARAPEIRGRHVAESGAAPLADPPHCGDIHISVSALGADTADWPSTHGQQVGRVLRDGVPSTCDPKICPGLYSSTDNHAYDAYGFSNGTCFDACITATLTSTCAPFHDIFAVAYVGTFDPANLCTNYLGDAGFSPNWSGAGASVNFQFTIPAHGNVVLVVHEIISTYGCWDGYTLDLHGVPCSATDLTVGSASIVNDVCALGGPGNANGYLDLGEKTAVSITAKNIGEVGATGISATLTSPSPYVTILQGGTTFPDIACGSAVNSSPNFSFYLAITATCGTDIPFTVHFTSNEGSWESDFSLPVTPTRTSTVLNESFETWPLTSWTILNNGGVCVWDSAITVYGRQNGTGGAGDCADADSDMCGDAMDTSLVSPVLDLSDPGISSATLSFNSWFLLYAPGDTGLVDITTDGTNWSNLITYSADSGPLTESVSLTPYVGSATTQIRFTYYGPGWEYLWEVDDVSLSVFGASLCASDACTCPAVTPTITGDSIILCPSTDIALSTQTGKSNYNWYKNYVRICSNSPTCTGNGPGSYWVYYEEANGCSGVSTVHTVTQETIPSAPTDVVAMQACAGNSISWTNAPTAMSHNVVRGTACGMAVDTFTGVTSPFNDDTAVAGTTYQYWVVGVNNCGPSARSSCSSATRPGVPAAPTSVLATPACTGNSISWTNAPTAASHNLIRGTACHTDLDTFEGVTSPYNDNTAVAGTAYQYWVVGLNTCGTGLGSSCAPATRPGIPGVPTGVSATSGCTGNSISWTDAPLATSHNVLRGTTCGTAVTTFTGVTSPYLDTTAVAGTTYNYWVEGVSACGTGTGSSCDMALRLGEVRPEEWIDKTTLSWPSTAGATSYKVYRGVQSELPNLLDGSVDSCTKYAGSLLNCAENDDPTSEAGRFYWYLVAGVNATCEGTAGNATAGTRIPNSSGACP